MPPSSSNALCSGRAPVLQLAVVCACVLLSANAAAQTVSPYYLGGLVAYGHQSNALGLTDEATTVPPGYASKSDKVTSVALVAGLDQPIGRQRLFGDLSWRDNRYDRNELLNHHSYALAAGVDWQTIERISGNLSFRTNRDLVQFSSFEQPTGGRNLVTTRAADASARIGGVTRYTFETAFNYRSIDYSDPGYNSRDLRQHSASVGVRYSPSGTNYLGLTLRDTRGRYPSFQQTTSGVVEDRFDRQDVEASALVQFSGASSIFGRLSYSKADFERQDNQDLSGFTGAMRATYVPTGKLRFSAELARDRGSDIQFNLDAFGSRVESARLATAARFRAEYSATAKVSAAANVGYTQRSVAVTNPFFGFADEGRERTVQFGMGVTWTPTRTSRVGCDYSRDRRRSDIAAAQLNISSASTNCYAQLTVQP
ncbi:MAG TPA: hypothetical protein VEZ89_01825 [Rubrivivax sp.]|nr:hypothetical protein [Rubrivivax sp.]